MVRITGPLHSDGASKQLGKTLIFKTKAGRSFLTNYKKPGGVKKFTPSTTQLIMRDYMKDARDAWAGLPDSDKTAWRDFVTPRRGG